MKSPFQRPAAEATNGTTQEQGSMRKQEDYCRDNQHQSLSLAADFDSFLLSDEDEREFLDFRTRQVLALEPKGLFQLQLALAIADIGWEINRYNTIMDRLSPKIAVASQSESTRHPVIRAIRLLYSRVRHSCGFDRTMVTFSPLTRGLIDEANNLQLLESRVSELETHIECLNAELRAAQAAAAGTTYVFGRTKLH